MGCGTSAVLVIKPEDDVRLPVHRTSLLSPVFDEVTRQKKHYRIAPGKRCFSNNTFSADGHFAIANEPICTWVDGTHVFAAAINRCFGGSLFVGFTDQEYFSMVTDAFPGNDTFFDSMSGVSLDCFTGKLHPGNAQYFEAPHEKYDTESRLIVLAIVIISEEGKMEFVWEINGIQGPRTELRRSNDSDENALLGAELYPCVSFTCIAQSVTPVSNVQLLKKLTPKSKIVEDMARQEFEYQNSDFMKQSRAIFQPEGESSNESRPCPMCGYQHSLQSRMVAHYLHSHMNRREYCIDEANLEAATVHFAEVLRSGAYYVNSQGVVMKRISESPNAPAKQDAVRDEVGSRAAVASEVVTVNSQHDFAASSTRTSNVKSTEQLKELPRPSASAAATSSSASSHENALPQEVSSAMPIDDLRALAKRFGVSGGIGGVHRRTKEDIVRELNAKLRREQPLA